MNPLIKQGLELLGGELERELACTPKIFKASRNEIKRKLKKIKELLKESED